MPCDVSPQSLPHSLCVQAQDNSEEQVNKRRPQCVEGEKKNPVLNCQRCCKSVSRAGPGPLLTLSLTPFDTQAHLYPACPRVAKLTRSTAILWGICQYSVCIKHLFWTCHRYRYLNTNISVCTWPRTEASYEIILLYLKYIFTHGIGLCTHFTTKESIWLLMTGFLWMSSNSLRSMFTLFVCFDSIWDIELLSDAAYEHNHTGSHTNIYTEGKVLPVKCVERTVLRGLHSS